MKVYVTNENNRLLRNLNDGVDLTKWINDQITRGYITSGVSSLASLTDVNLTGLQPDYVLTYDAVSGKWVPRFNAATGGNPAGTTGQIQFNNNGAFGASSNLFWDAGNSRLGIGMNTPLATVNIKGVGSTNSTTSFLVENSLSTDIFKVNDDGTFLIGQAVSALSYISGGNSGSFYRAGGTGHSFNYINVPRMVVGEFGTSFTNSNNSLSGDRSGLLNSSTFNPTSGTANYFSLNLQSTINQTGGSNGVTRGLFVNPTLTSAFDWRSIEWNNNTGWGLYGNGTANNYLAGNLAVGTTSPSARLTVQGSGTTSGTTGLLVQNNNSQTIFSVTDHGFVRFGNLGSVSPVIFSAATSPSSQDMSGRNLSFYNYNTNNGGSRFSFIGESITETSGSISHINSTRTFAPTSGTASYTEATFRTTVNQTGDANGITRGLLVSPILTSAIDWRSIEWSNNTGWGLYGAGTANNYLAGSLGIGTTSWNNSALNVLKTITGSTVVNSIINNSTIASDVTTEAAYYSTNAGTLNASFTLSFLEHYAARQGTFGLSSTVINQCGFFVSSGLTGATNNYGFFGNIPSGTGRWNLYMNGTANNYLAGNTSIGTTETGARLNVRGSGTTNGIDALLVEASDGTDLFEVENGGLISVGKNVGATTQSTATIRVISGDTNTGLALVPKGGGAITAQIPDNTIAGGEPRGANAVDFQMSRSSVSEVAKGSLSVVVGGQSNTAFASRSVVLGGQSNNASGVYSSITGGLSNNASGSYASITGGTGNTAGGASSVVSGGTTNSSGGANSCIGGGQSNSSSGAHSTVCGGLQNTASGSYSTVVGGLAGLANIPFQTVLGSNGVFGFVGDNQTSVVRVRATSTSNQVTEMFITGSARLVLVLPANTTTRVWNAIVQCVAIINNPGGSTLAAGSCISQNYELTIKRTSTGVSLVGTPNRTTNVHDTHMSTADFLISADTNNNSLKIEFQPPSGTAVDTTIRALATIYLTELGY